MAGLERLQALIYHETQGEGSMLCAQHALNALLQDRYFTPADLADVAHELDQLEQSYNENQANTSTNMDDTGFFSVQVIENALKVWNLSLAPWRGSAMRPYHDEPHKQLAFILNQNQHWYTLRRFGNASPILEDDPGEGHWFNLNSALDSPEWISKTYLGMFLQQAETEGYSVFAIVQANANDDIAVPRVEADIIASTLPEPTSSSRNAGHTMGGDDEDAELQAALHASLFGAESASSTPGASGSSSAASSDPVSLSQERHRNMLLRMKEEQEQAQRELWASGHRRPDTPDNEDEMLRQAIAESEALMKRDMDTSDSPSVGAEISAPQSRGSPSFMSPDGPRVYDDEDAELQAALRASLQDGPIDFTPTTEDSNTVPPTIPQTSLPSNTAAPAIEADAPSDDEMAETAAPVENLDVDEMRRRRLARFGG